MTRVQLIISKDKLINKIVGLNVFVFCLLFSKVNLVKIWYRMKSKDIPSN